MLRPYLLGENGLDGARILDVALHGLGGVGHRMGHGLGGGTCRACKGSQHTRGCGWCVCNKLQVPAAVNLM